MPASVAHLSPLDLTIVALYLVGITLFGLRFRNRASAGAAKSSSLKSYFLADNVIPWWAIALSIVSAETSTLTIISIPGVAYAGDLGFLQIVFGYMLGRVVVAMLFLPRYFRGEMLTAYQLIDQRFGVVLHRLTAGLFLLTRAAAEGVRVFAISIVVGIAIGTGDTLSIAIISALTLLYTFEGGMAAVIWTDVVQTALYVAGTVVALATLGAHVPGGWGHIHAVAAPLGKFHVLHFALNLTTAYTFWAGVLGGTFLTMASHGTDQLMVQRMLAARSLRESRLALLSSGVVIFVQFTLFLLIGVGLFVFYGLHPQVFASADRIFPTFIVHEMPRGLAGLLVAAILAAAMSNLSAALNSLASTTVVDFWVPLRRGRASNTERVSRVATVFWSAVLFGIAVYAIQHGGKGHVVETGLSIASVAYGCLLGVFLLGTLTRYATQWGTVIGMACGLGVNLALWQDSLAQPFVRLGLPHVAFTWYVLIGAVVTFIVGSLFSLISGRRSAAAALLLVAIPLCPLSSRSAAQGSAAAFQAWSPVPNNTGVLHFVQDDGVKQTTAKAYDFSGVDAAITQAIAAKKLPGAVVVIGHGGRIAYEKAYGNRALEPVVEPMTDETLFDMASLTKVLVTTTAVLQLYEQGKVDLDAPVAKYLPDFAVNGKAKITVRELLTHYSGLPEDVDLKDAWGLAAPDKAEGARRALAAVPYGPAGVSFKYSDINFITLGLLVEQVAGQPLDVYAREHIFLPLDMMFSGYHAFDKTCGPAIKTGAAVAPGPRPVGRILVACLPYTWSPYALDPNTAPTAHDDQGTAATNPDFDKLLRGTVHDPTTRRMGGVAGHAGVFSTAADAAKFCQALLDRLLRDKGPFPLKQATLRLAIGPQAPAGASGAARIFNQDGTTTKGVAQRGLGWDLNSAYSRPRGTAFPLGVSFGHTGFTGTSIWIDPGSDSYVVLLANAIHPRGGAPISTLRGDVATAAATALGVKVAAATQARIAAASARLELGAYDPARPCAPPVICDSFGAPQLASSRPATLTGIDVLEAEGFAPLLELAAQHGGTLRMGLLTNQSGLDAAGHRTIDVLTKAAPGLKLETLFTPEHGLLGKQDTDHLAAQSDAATHLPVISLYGPKPSDKRPRLADLKKLDAIVIDLQDAGVRSYTYETLTGYFLEACARAKIAVVVLDRPNPIGGVAVEGPTSDPGLESYNDFMPIPLRNGLTLGELARYFNTHAKLVSLDPALLDAGAVQLGPATSGEMPPATQPGLHAALTVIAMQHWTRGEYFDQTGLAFTPPSPNLNSTAAEVLLPALTMLETTNVSVGRGTALPFQDLGAVWMTAASAKALADALTARAIAGVTVTPTTLNVAENSNRYPGHGQAIAGIHFNVTDRAAFDSPEFGLELLSALHRLFPAEFQMEKAKTIIANAETMAELKAGKDPREIAAGWQVGVDAFRAASKTSLLYGR